MCQPFGTNVTAVCRLPHAKAITGQIMLYLENFNKAAKCRQNRGPGLGGVMPLRVGPLPIFCPYPSVYVYNLYALYHKRSLMAHAFLFLSD